MAEAVVSGVRLVLRYSAGSFTYSYLKPSAASAKVYELCRAINSLQAEPFKSAGMVVTERIAAD